jgi:hypothetical protein
VIRGSGRLADEIATAVREDAAPSSNEIAVIVRDGRIILFDIAEGPAALAALIRRRLFEESWA